MLLYMPGMSKSICTTGLILIIQFVEIKNVLIENKVIQDLSLKDLMVWMVELGKVALLFMWNRIRCWFLAWHMVEYYMVSRLINFMGIDSSHGTHKQRWVSEVKSKIDLSNQSYFYLLVFLFFSVAFCSRFLSLEVLELSLSHFIHNI